LKLTINKESPIAVRDQLVEQIGLQIASGLLKGQDKLPSIRALAQRLGIHHSTVTSAYNHLAEVGLLEVRQGSGVRVATASPATPTHQTRHMSMDALMRSFLSQAADNGFSRKDLEERFRKILDKKPVARILVVDRNKDFHKLLMAELQPHFQLPVVPITPQELSDQQKLLEDSLVLTSLYHVFPLQDLPIDPTRFVVCNIEPGREQMDVITTLPPTSIVMLVSVSPTLLKMARNVAAATRGEDVAVRTVLLEEAQEIEYMMKYVKAVICDGPSAEKVREVAGKIPVHVFHLYSTSTFQLIKDRLAKWG
jgi:DNA-binding transcriptional regulator YhcF (GntR family)